MEYQITSQDVTYQDYPVHYPFAVSSLESIDTINLMDALSSAWIRQKKPKFLPYQNLIPLFEIDYSSVRPRFEMKSESSLMIFTRILEEIIIGDMVENDFIVKIPPVKVYSMRLRVKSIKRATPRITEPEGV